MATSVSFNGTSYSIPANREPRGWGTSLSAFLVDVANSALSKSGGTFTLTADANFGANYGLVSKYFKSTSSNISTTGVVRFANNEGIGWRNAANSADLILKVDASNNLEYNGNDVPTVADKLSVFAATTSSELAGVISDETGSGALVFATSPTLVTPNLGTPSAATLTNATGLPISTGVSGLGSNVATFLATPSSANLASAVTDETGSGALVFGTSPTLTTPNIGVATATSVNGTTIPSSKTLVVTTDNLSALASTTSAQLAGVISDETGSGALVFGTSPSLGSPTITDYSLFTEASAPSTPAAGKIAIYAKSDKKVYKKDSNGTESELGAGGTSAINYIDNYDFETGATTGWSSYDDGASATPVDGTGGSPSTLTLSANSSSPLRGVYDFKIAKSAADSQGEGFSYDFTIDTPDKSKKLAISFDLNSSDSNYTAGDVVVYVYDVTNATLITPSSTSLPKMSGSHWLTFDSTTSTSYRLIFHWAVTTASAVNLYFDNIVVGPDVPQQGAAVGEWQSFTPTFNNLSVTNNGSFYRRVGSSIEIMVDVSASADATGQVQWNLLGGITGLTADTSKFGSRQVFGAGVLACATNSYVVNPQYSGSATYAFFRLDATANLLDASNPSADGGVDSTDRLTFTATFPISEWAGGTVNLGPGAQVEYAYNNSAGTGTDSSSFAYGPSGVAFRAFAPSGTNRIDKRVRFQYPIQADDLIVVEVAYKPSASFPELWYPVADYAPVSANDAGTTRYGIEVNPVSGSTTDVDVGFYSAAMPGVSWSTNYYWRVRKAKASSPVGFGKANSNEFGLVAPRKGQYNLTVTATFTSWSTTRAIGIYYQDQDGNHRFKFNIRGTKTSGTETAGTLTITGVTFKNVSSWEQACCGFTSNGLPIGVYTNPNASTIGVAHASQTTTYYSISGDVELDSKPSWA